MEEGRASWEVSVHFKGKFVVEWHRAPDGNTIQNEYYCSGINPADLRNHMVKQIIKHLKTSNKHLKTSVQHRVKQ